MREIGPRDLADLARGAAILGAGGGGDPYIGRLLAERVVRTHGPVRVLPPDEVPADAVVAPVAIMGAPTVIVEKPPSGGEFARAMAALGETLGAPVTHVACMEAGGLNSMIPIAAAAAAGLPLIDGDGMGRAFPELQMTVPTIDGVSTTPMAMADDKGNTVVLRTVDNPWAERLARSATVDMGCSASIALYPMTGAQARTSLLSGTLTQAHELGRIVRECRAEHRNAARTIAAEASGALLFTGKVVDVERRTTGGFVRGDAALEGIGADRDSRMTLAFQNENLVARRDGRTVASVPDLICALEVDTGEPVTTEALRYGYRVDVVGLPCHPRWRTPEGLALVGPRYFGYEHDYEPIAAH